MKSGPTGGRLRTFLVFEGSMCLAQFELEPQAASPCVPRGVKCRGKAIVTRVAKCMTATKPGLVLQ